MPTKHLSRHIYSAPEVSEVYKAIDRNCRNDILEEIQKYHYWFYDCFCLHEIGKFIWCTDDHPISMFLTDQGIFYDLDHVAKQYIKFVDELMLEFPWFVEKIEVMAAKFHTNSMPPIIISACRFRPRYYIIDGFHRGLSVLINELRGIGNQKSINAFVGYNIGAALVKEAIFN